MRITASLDKLLRRVRLTEEPRRLWADQICINQDSHRGKEHQVGLMGDIYRKAKRVLIWLGGDMSDGSNVASLIEEVNARIDKQLPEYGSWDELPNASPDDPFFQDRTWRSLDAAFTSPWFTRVWVIQEVGLAQDPWVLYGKSEFDWTSLMRVSQWTLDFANFRLDLTSFPLHSIHTATMDGWALKRSTQQTKRDFGTFSKDWTLLKLLNSAKGLKATDPSDHIYSFLGHPSASRNLNHSTIVAPDYTIDYLTAFYKFATQWLDESQASSLLLAVEHDAKSLDEEFPSWVPRWNIYSTAQTLGLQTKLPFNASKGKESTPVVLLDSRRLKFHGVVFDAIQAQSVTLDRESLRLPDLSTAEMMPRSANPVVTFWEYISNARASSAYIDDQRPLMAFVRTLTGERYTGKHAQFQADRYAYCLRLLQLSKGNKDEDIDALKERARAGNISTFIDHAWYFCNRRVLVHTEGGRYDFAPQCTKSGDLCCILFGCKVPLILRRTGQPSQYRLVGEGHIQGLMEGEVVESWKAGELQDEKFILL